jgi:hypothetical protein
VSVLPFDSAEERQLTIDDLLGYAFHGCGNIRVQPLALCVIEERM